jgi:hypothetical protein
MTPAHIYRAALMRILATAERFEAGAAKVQQPIGTPYADGIAHASQQLGALARKALEDGARIQDMTVTPRPEMPR